MSGRKISSKAIQALEASLGHFSSTKIHRLAYSPNITHQKTDKNHQFARNWREKFKKLLKGEVSSRFSCNCWLSKRARMRILDFLGVCTVYKLINVQNPIPWKCRRLLGMSSCRFFIKNQQITFEAVNCLINQNFFGS